MDCSSYHLKYARQPDAIIQKKVNEKKQELSAIFAQVPLNTTDQVVEIAVLGCGDRRLIKYHREIFQAFMTRPIRVTTFDITTKHLAGEQNVCQHDCTLPLPHGPFDITYAHVLLRFIESEKQWDLINNSYIALKPGGLAIHVLDRIDYQIPKTKSLNGLHFVPLDQWRTRLNAMGTQYREIPVKYGLALVILKE